MMEQKRAANKAKEAQDTEEASPAKNSNDSDYLFSLLYKRTTAIALATKAQSALNEFVQDSQDAFQQELENKAFNNKLHKLNETERAQAIAQRDEQRKQIADLKRQTKEIENIVKSKKIAEEEQNLRNAFGKHENESAGQFRSYLGFALNVWSISRAFSPASGGSLSVSQSNAPIINSNGTAIAGSIIPANPGMMSTAMSKVGATLGSLFSFRGSGSFGEQKPPEMPKGDTGNNSKETGKCSENCKILPAEGQVINGRYYTKHALERMAPKTFETMAELERRALARGFARGSKEFKAYVQPRDIPLSVVEDALTNGISQIGKELDTIEYITSELKVITNSKGDITSVFRI